MPDAPLNLVNVVEITNAFNIGMDWDHGLDDGGSPVIDFKVWYALENEAYVNYVEGITTDFYTTEYTTEHGRNYKFKVQARNSVGFSLPSQEVIIRAARIPDPPTAVNTFIIAPNVNVDDMVISWTAEYDGGSPVIAFTILVLEGDAITFTEDSVNCAGTDQTIVNT